MIRISEMQNKNVINTADGRYMGNLQDIEIDVKAGKIRSLFLPNETKGFFKKYEPLSIPWHEVRKIGFDVILIESFGQVIPPHLLEEHNSIKK